MNKILKKSILLSLCVLLDASPQSVVDSISIKVDDFKTEEPFVEKIKIISPSKKIFILSNENEKMTKGDFISFVSDKKLVARAVVAKIDNNLSAIKVVKIYSLQRWSKLKKDSTVEIIRGDDSYLNIKEKKEDEKKEPSRDPMETGDLPVVSKKDKIADEEDLYSEDSSIDDTIDMKEKGNRSIRTDNIVGFSMGQIKVTDYLETQQSFSTMNLSWGYQFADNMWLEGAYSYAKMANFPADGVDAASQGMSGRLKYAIEAPLYTYLFPFVGYKFNTVQYPGIDDSSDPIQQEGELTAINKLKKSGAVMGITALRRLVPGWFLKVELEKDAIAPLSYNAGLSIEF